jgi:hypothetical protein
MTAKRYQAKRPVGLLTAGGVAGRAVATIDGTTLVMQQIAAGMIAPGAVTGRSVTKLVAASNASAQMVALADYVCDGTADEVQINAAITSVSLSGGVVQLSEGTFTVSSKILFNEGWQTLRGMGMGATTIAVVNAGGAPVNAEIIGMYGAHCEIADLTIDGNKANNAGATSMMGVYAMTQRDLLIQRVRVLNSAHDGIIIDAAVESGVVRDCLIEGSAATGMVLRGAANNPLTVSGCTVKGCTGTGFYCDSGPVVLSDCQSLTNGVYGFSVESTALASLSQCTAQSNGSYGFRVTAAQTQLNGCQAISNVGVGFEVTGARVQLTGCMAHGTLSDGHGFRSNTGASDILYSGCAAISNTDVGFSHYSTGQSTYIGCEAISNTYYGWYVNYGPAQIYSCYVVGLATSLVGIFLAGGANHSVDGCRVTTNGEDGILAYGATVTDVQLTNNVIADSSLSSDQGYTHVSIYAPRTFMQGNMLWTPVAGNRPWTGIGIDGTATNCFLGHNDTAGTNRGWGEVYIPGTANTTMRRTAKLQLDYAASTDLMSNTALPLNTVVVVVPDQTFRVDNRDSLIEISVRGTMLAGSSPGTIATLVTVDNGQEATIKHGVGYVEVGNWQNPLAGGQPYKLPKMYLGPGNHTVRLEIRANNNAAIGYLRAATQPDYEFVQIQVMEYKN